MIIQSSTNYKVKIKGFITCVLLLLMVVAHTQTKDSLVHEVLLRISQLQSQGDKYFLKGVMPTYRDYEKNHNDIKPDNTIFTTCVVVFILNKDDGKFCSNTEDILECLLRGLTKH